MPADVRLTVLSTVFYRGMGAYLIGRMTRGAQKPRALAIAFVHRGGRIAADGLITLIPNRGAVVKRLTRAELEELFPVMGALG